MISTQEHLDRLRLYQAGMSDQEISKALYLNRNTIAYWRRRNGLPSQNPRKRITGEQLKLMQKMYQSGASDQEIAKRIQKKRGTVCAWRWRNGLKANYGPAGRRKKND